MDIKQIDAQHLVNLTLLKNILFKADLSLSIDESKEMLKHMNEQLEISKSGILLKVDFTEVEYFLKHNFQKLSDKFIASQNYLRTSFLYMDALYDPIEIFAYRQITNKKFNKKNIVQKINKEIVQKISDKNILSELTMWRRWTLDGHNDNSEYFYLQEWDTDKQMRANFHNYSIEKDVSIENSKEENKNINENSK